MKRKGTQPVTSLNRVAFISYCVEQKKQCYGKPDEGMATSCRLEPALCTTINAKEFRLTHVLRSRSISGHVKPLWLTRALESLITLKHLCACTMHDQSAPCTTNQHRAHQHRAHQQRARARNNFGLCCQYRPKLKLKLNNGRSGRTRGSGRTHDLSGDVN